MPLFKNDSNVNELERLSKLDYSVLDKPMGMAQQGVVDGFVAAIDMLNQKLLKHFLLGIAAGIFVALAYIGCFYAAYLVPNASVRRIIFAAIFPSAIIFIVFIGGGFLTAYMFSTIPMLKRNLGFKPYLMGLGGVYLGNFIGQFIFMLLWFSAGAMRDPELTQFIFEFSLNKLDGTGTQLLELLGKQIDKLDSSTTFKTFIYCFFSAILCNFLVQQSVPISRSVKDKLALIILLSVIIFMFVISGLQHCVANLFLMIWLLVANWWEIEVTVLNSFQQAESIKVGAQLAWLFFGLNIIPAILGNYLGGISMAGLLYWINHEKVNLKLAQLRLQNLQQKSTN
ncbi:formate/nitrite transporter family protein [Mesoplasma seiffertii]|uniref:formate/nitrite transporter family protein n=1 Tax=Mesoplasma seiffertii TaxID=28224 RepID=UPI00047A6A42|nr:formate/nitrite transporter family protein [Mesoplasma seiffertii]